MNRVTGCAVAGVWSLNLLFATVAASQEPAVETVLAGLRDPRGVAVRPPAENAPVELFVAESGAGRVVRIAGDPSAKSADAINDFAAGAGPLGLLFIDRDRLIVACEDPPVLRLYDLSDQTLPVAVDAARQQVTLSPDTADAQLDSGDVIGLARTRANDKVFDVLIATCPGRSLPGWPRRIPVRAGTLDESSAFLADGGKPQQLALGGVAVSDHGYVVVSRSSAGNESPASRLTFINPIDGAIVMDVPVDVDGIIGLAYHPTSGDLYAIATGGDAPGQGGVYRVDDASQRTPRAKGVKIASINEPTSMAFAPDGTLYVTAASAANDSTNERGVLLRIRTNL